MSLVLLGERGRKSGAGAVKEWVKAPIVVVVDFLFRRYDHLKMPTWSAFRGLIATVYWTFAHN